MADSGSKTKKPANTRFKQQRLPAWQPILTAGTVLPTFFVVGILFIPIGIGVLYFSDNVVEKIVPYTNCKTPGGTNCEDDLKKANSSVTCSCIPIAFELKQDLLGEVYLYYALTNFYQNHRRYVRSRDDKQLYGDWDFKTYKTSANCEPFHKDGDKAIYPCGAVANSFFQDKITLHQGDKEIKLKKTGIAWETDKKYKFRKPSFWGAAAKTSSHEAWSKITKPKAWSRQLWDWPEGVEDEDFIVWMRISAKPNFRKLYRIVDNGKSNQSVGLAKGTYQLKIEYSFPVSTFGGTKSVVITTTSILGGKNPFLGIAYVIIGAICLILGILFLVIHINYGKKNYIKPNDAVVQDTSEGPSAPSSSHVGHTSSTHTTHTTHQPHATHTRGDVSHFK